MNFRSNHRQAITAEPCGALPKCLSSRWAVLLVLGVACSNEAAIDSPPLVDQGASDGAADHAGLDINAQDDTGDAGVTNHRDAAGEPSSGGPDAVVDVSAEPRSEAGVDATGVDATTEGGAPDATDGGSVDASVDAPNDTAAPDATDDGIPDATSDPAVDQGAPPIDVASDGGYQAGALATCESAILDALPDAGNVTVIPSLGLQKAAARLFKDGDLVVGAETADIDGGWILWNAATGKEIAQGSPGIPMGLAGGVLGVQESGAFRLLNTSDGSLRATIPLAQDSWGGLAVDGSYAFIVSQTAISVWSTTGTPWATKAGDYGGAYVYAAPGELRVAKQLGMPVVETIVANGGSTAEGPPYVGQFRGWFLDGSQYFTLENDNLHIYTVQGVQTHVSAATGSILGGVGSYFWTQNQYGLQFFQVGGNGQPIKTYPLDARARIGSSLKRIAIVDDGPQQVTIVHLDAPATSETVYLPFPDVQSFAGDESGNWTFGGKRGEVYFSGTGSLPARKGRLGCGQVLRLAGSPSGSVAVATASKLLIVNPAESIVTALNVVAGNVSYIDTSDNGGLALSGDGRTAVAVASDYSPYITIDRSVYVYNWPSWNVVRVYPFENGRPNAIKNSFDLSQDGKTFAVQLGKYSSNWNFDTTVTDIVPAQPSIWKYAGTVDAVPLLSPNGKRFTVTSALRAATSTTVIYENGAAKKTITGSAVGWLDDDHFLVQSYLPQPGMAYDLYEKSEVYDGQGNLAWSPPLPETKRFDLVGPFKILSKGDGNIYDVITGAVTSTELPAGSVIAGPYIISVSGRSLRATRY